MFNNLQLRNKMLVFFIIPTLLVLSVISYLSYNTAYNALNSEVRESLTWQVGAETEKIDNWLASRESLVVSTAAALAHQAPGSDVRGLLVSLKQSSDGITNVFVGYADGRYQDAAGWTPPAGYDPRTRDWYKAAVGASGAVYSELYIDQSTNLPTFSVLTPIKQNGQVIGVVGADLELAGINAIAKEVKSEKTGYAFIIDKKGNYIYHPTLKLSDNIFTLQNGVFAESGKAYLSGKAAVQSYTFGGVAKFYASAPVGKTGWAFVLGVPEAELFESLSALTRSAVISSLAGLILLGLIIFFIANSIARPIKNVAQVAEKIAQGDLAVDLSSLNGVARDEVGILTQAVTDMVGNLNGLVKHISYSAEQVAASSEQLTASAQQSVQASNQIATSITDVAGVADEQLAAANETTAVVEQVSAGIQEVAANTNQVAEQSAQAADKAKEGDKAVEKAVNQMAHIEGTVNTSAQVVAKLGERSKEIGQIVDTISGIAGQTNLLALNAAIEAARAGEQGRGFAVVAEEVRKLAEQSQEAAKKIAELIAEIQGDTDKAVMAMNDGTREVKTGAEVVNAAGMAFREIVELISRVSSQVREISAAIQQMASGSQQVVGTVKKIDTLSKRAADEAQSVSAATEEQLASMEEIETSSEALAKLAQDLQTAVAKFRV